AAAGQVSEQIVFDQVVTLFVHQRAERDEVERAVGRDQQPSRGVLAADRFHQLRVQRAGEFLHVSPLWVPQRRAQFFNRPVDQPCLAQVEPQRFAFGGQGVCEVARRGAPSGLEVVWPVGREFYERRAGRNRSGDVGEELCRQRLCPERGDAIADLVFELFDPALEAFQQRAALGRRGLVLAF